MLSQIAYSFMLKNSFNSIVHGFEILKICFIVFSNIYFDKKW